MDGFFYPHQSQHKQTQRKSKQTWPLSYRKTDDYKQNKSNIFFISFPFTTFSQTSPLLTYLLTKLTEEGREERREEEGRDEEVRDEEERDEEGR